MFFIILLRVIIALDLLLNRRRKIHIVPSGFSVKGSMMCLTQSLWYIYFKFNIFLIFCTLAFLILLYQYTCKEFPSLYYKKVKLQKKSSTVKAFDIVIDNYELASSTLDFQSYPYTFIWWGNTYKSLSQIPYK